MRRSQPFAIAFLSGVALRVAAQPFGASSSEFRVNTETTFTQAVPVIAYHGTGEFLVAWFGYGQLVSNAILAQRYVGGAAAGAEFRVSTYTSGVPNAPRVASVAGSSSTHFVVVWQNRGEDGDGYGVFGQRYDDTGPLGAEFQVNTHTTGYEYRADVAMDANGDFVVVWQQPDADGYGIFARRYAATGDAQGAVFRVNTYTTGVQSNPAVARSASGDFVVAWMSDQEFGTATDIVARRFSGAGAPLTDDFLVEVTTTEPHLAPSIAPVGVDSGFVVTWAAPQSTVTQIYARRYDSSGAPLTSAFRVNSTTTANNDVPNVASDAGGEFTVVWEGLDPDAARSAVFAQRYASSGAPVGSEFRVNASTAYYHDVPRVSMSSNGSFTVVWWTLSLDQSTSEVYARRFCALEGDADGNNALGVADVFWLINSLFASGPAPVHPADANGDGKVDVGDVFYLINYLFAGGPAPGCAL